VLVVVGLLPRVGRKTEDTPVVASTAAPTVSRFDREPERRPADGVDDEPVRREPR
jgi:hypothetical protein